MVSPTYRALLIGKSTFPGDRHIAVRPGVSLALDRRDAPPEPDVSTTEIDLSDVRPGGELAPASWGSRIGAAAIDGMILAAYSWSTC